MGIKDIMQFMLFIKKPFLIDSRESLLKAAETYGILPFFPNNIKGLSVEEMCAPGMLFGGNYEEGCWEWKGPVIRQRTTAYGKFFKRKAGFVSLDLLPYFLNYRRTLYPVKVGTTDEMLLDIIKENDSLSSTELKRLVFGSFSRRDFDEVPEAWINQKSVLSSESDGKKSSGRKSLESPLQRLQMGGWIIISDFEYKTTKRGERYGWGVARYSTPEITFGDTIRHVSCSPEDSLNYIIEKMQSRWPYASRKVFKTLIS